MSVELMKTLHENAEHAKHDRSMAPVSLTMAVLAVFATAMALIGHRAHTEEAALLGRVTDSWAHYQAKAIRQNTDQMFVDLVSIVPSTDSKLASQLRARYERETKRYSADKNMIGAGTRKLESEIVHEEKRADYYDLGEVLVQIAIVITSITLISKQKIFWLGGIIVGMGGLAMATIGVFVL